MAEINIFIKRNTSISTTNMRKLRNIMFRPHNFAPYVREHWYKIYSTRSERTKNTERPLSITHSCCKAAFKRATHGFLETRHNFTVIIRRKQMVPVVSSSHTKRIAGYNRQLLMQVRDDAARIAVVLEKCWFPRILFPIARSNQILLAVRYNYHRPISEL